jgi:hypothetical protein
LRVDGTREFCIAAKRAVDCRERNIANKFSALGIRDASVTIRNRAAGECGSTSHVNVFRSNVVRWYEPAQVAVKETPLGYGLRLGTPVATAGDRRDRVMAWFRMSDTMRTSTGPEDSWCRSIKKR